MTVVATVAGTVLIAVALRDVFNTLFRPTARWTLEHGIVRLVTAALRSPAARPVTLAAGPAAFVVVVATWTALVVVGCALVFWPQLPDGFRFDAGLTPADHDGFIDALYFSLVTLTSLGYGDVTPNEGWLRVMGPVETMLGLALVTASISWLVSIRAVLSARRSLGHEAHLAREAEDALGAPLPAADPQLCEALIAGLTSQLVTVRQDLLRFPLSHLFHEDSGDESLSAVLPFLRRLAEEGTAAGVPVALRVRAHMLDRAIADYERAVGEHAPSVR